MRRNGGMADASDSKSDVGDYVRVQVPSLAPPSLNNQICGCGGKADALATGASVRMDVGVQVPPSAP